MSKSRPHIPCKTKLAATLCQMKVVDEEGRLVDAISFEDAQKMTAEQILSLFHFDHYPVRKAEGGPDEPWNLTPRFIPAHRLKTAKKDQPEIAKNKRISEAHEEFRRRILAKTTGEPVPEPAKPKRKWPSRPVDGSKNSPWKKHADGRVSRRSNTKETG